MKVKWMVIVVLVAAIIGVGIALGIRYQDHQDHIARANNDAKAAQSSVRDMQKAYDDLDSATNVLHDSQEGFDTKLTSEVTGIGAAAIRVQQIEAIKVQPTRTAVIKIRSNMHDADVASSLDKISSALDTWGQVITSSAATMRAILNNPFYGMGFDYEATILKPYGKASENFYGAVLSADSLIKSRLQTLQGISKQKQAVLSSVTNANWALNP